uniref:Uncharacterized protein n=1 Tax=Romanomermis culicivorax TaxID=13658 RepID=A0A915JA28_ROMCU
MPKSRSHGMVGQSARSATCYNQPHGVVCQTAATWHDQQVKCARCISARIVPLNSWVKSVTSAFSKPAAWAASLYIFNGSKVYCRFFTYSLNSSVN